MNRMMGIINLDYEQDLLNELTYFRCSAAVPFAAKYRIIDFILSNMVNSRITEVGIFARKKYRSLLDHLGKGKSWDLDRARGGLFILPPDWNDPTDISKGELQHYHNNLDIFERSLADYIVISGSRHICHINFQDVLKVHLAEGNDITLIYTKDYVKQESNNVCSRLSLDNHRVIDIHNDLNNENVYMDMFLIKKDLLLDIVDHCIAHGAENLFYQGIKPRLHDFKIGGYEYRGYHAVIHSIKSYYEHSMNLLNQENFKSLFNESHLIYSKSKDESPVKYLGCSNVTNSLIANGCVIEGTVENSILFRGVRIAKGSKVVNSIILPKCEIGENAVLENVILDKDVKITDGRTIIGANEKPFVVAKRQVI